MREEKLPKIVTMHFESSCKALHLNNEKHALEITKLSTKQ